MSIASTVLFGKPQHEIASLINNKILTSSRFEFITGFATVEGVKALESSIKIKANSVKNIVIGAATYRGYEALDELVGLGVPISNLFVHLGHTRLTYSGAKHPFYRYHPMLHSKLYYFEDNKGMASAIIGSHNMTGFALGGLNGEASVLIEGDRNDAEFEKIRIHLAHAISESVNYQPAMKDAYVWWTAEFIEGLKAKADDIPRDLEKKKTVLILCEQRSANPKLGELLYFELPASLGSISSFGTDVHLYVFDKLPATSNECLLNLHRAIKSFWCTVSGMENDKGGRELTATWYLEDYSRPHLKRAPFPFRPTPTFEMQQVRIELKKQLFGSIQYLFGKQGVKWLPILNKEVEISFTDLYASLVESVKTIPPEHKSWFLVTDLIQSQPENVQKDESEYSKTLRQMSPESGAYLLFSTARRKGKLE